MSTDDHEAVDDLPDEALEDRGPVWTDIDELMSWAEYHGRSRADAKVVDGASATELESEAADEASDREVEVELRKTDLEAAQQAHEMRESFYRWVIRAVSLTLVASAASMVAYLWSQWGSIAPAVMVAFYSAVVVQVIGLAYIIARYLFAPRGQAANGSQSAAVSGAADR